VKKKQKIKYFALNLIQKKKKHNIVAGKFKQIILMLIASFFNVFDFFYSSNYNILYVSWTQHLVFSSVELISGTLICSYSLGFKIKKHHKFALITISICVFIYYWIDPLLRLKYFYFNQFIVMMFSYFLVIFTHVGFSLNNCIEKYLADTYYVSPFIILIFEGVFELIMVLALSGGADPFNGFKEVFATFSTGNLVLFVVLVVLNVIFQVIVAIYKIYCNVEYSPMARSLVHYAMSPFLFIYFFFEERGYYYTALYFIAIELICIAISFSGCVFNEYIILYCCGLEYDTQDEVANRANNQFQNEFNDIDETSSNNENPENNDNNSQSNTVNGFGGYGLGI
jgi:hypothetical protein